MKILTYSMGGLLLEAYQKRLEALGRLVQAKKPEFVALQNMSLDGVKTLRSLPWANRYTCIVSPPASYEKRKNPVCVIMSIYPEKEMKWFNYRDPDSDQYILWCQFQLNDKQKQTHQLTIATTEMKIGTPSDVLEKYINQALFLTQSYEDCFMVGDFSLVEAINGQLTLHGNWRDAWLETPGNTSESGHSFVPANNVLIKEKSLPSFRPDRILYNTRRYKLVGVELVGIAPDETLGLPISNHYGVMANFVLLDNASFLPVVTPPEIPCSLEQSI